ncbi:hypothetical protein [Amorphus sp. 3PC139-8]|uniref:hypothetical protein n=1 Tax=Amorphus sp. 3PC139-8 TaxID=2735676 RepID=UPI00345DFB26
MSRLVTLLVVLAMAVQVIRPLGFPGFKRRADAWKLALVGFALVIVTVAIRPE